MGMIGGLTLYTDGWAPSPRRVNIFLAEKGIAIERVMVDIKRDAQLGAEYLAINPAGTLPALILDDGEVLTESVAICRYLEALHPTPALFGTAPVEIARIESWTRRIEQHGYLPSVWAFRDSHPVFVGRAVPGTFASPQIPALVERARLLWDALMASLDAQLQDREWIAGDTFSFADIMALTTIDFARMGRLAVPDEATAIRRWREQASVRPSAR